MGDRKLTYKEKADLHFIEQEEPAFIKEMKKKLGYKEAPKLEDKFAEEGSSHEADDPETELMRLREEDRPQVIVLNPETDMTHEDVKKALDAKQKEEDDQKIAEGKIVFKKPVKRTAEGSDEVDEKKKRDARAEPAKPQSRLLSFGDEDE